MSLYRIDFVGGPADGGSHYFDDAKMPRPGETTMYCESIEEPRTVYELFETSDDGQGHPVIRYRPRPLEDLTEEDRKGLEHDFNKSSFFGAKVLDRDTKGISKPTS